MAITQRRGAPCKAWSKIKPSKKKLPIADAAKELNWSYQQLYNAIQKNARNCVSDGHVDRSGPTIMVHYSIIKVLDKSRKHIGTFR